MAGGSCVPYGLHRTDPCEFWCKQRAFDAREFNRTESAGRHDGHAELPSPFRQQHSAETKWAEAASRRRHVVLSDRSDGHLEAGDGDAAHRSGERFRSGVRFHHGENSIPSFRRTCSAPLAQRQRHTPGNPAASHLDIAPEDYSGILPVASPSVKKTTFDFSKEKIHEED